MNKLTNTLEGLKPLRTNPAARSYFARCLEYGASRELTNSLGNIITVFPSRKDFVTKSVESLIELFVAMQLELLFHVKRFLAQGVPVMVKRPNARGYEYERAYHPDLVGVLTDGTEFAIGAKAHSYIQEDLKANRPRFGKNREGEYEDAAAKEALAKLNVHHFVVTERDFGPEFFSNACLLAPYVAADCPCQELVSEIASAIRAVGISTLERMALGIESRRAHREGGSPWELDRQLMLECIMWMIANGELVADLDYCSVQSIAKFEIYASRSLAHSRVQDRMAPSIPLIDATELTLTADAVVNFASENYTVINSVAGKVYLKDSAGKTRVFDQADLEKHFHSGELTCDQEESPEQLTPFAKADPERQAKAIERAEAIKLYEQGSKSIPERTYYYWKGLMSKARIEHDCGLSGLIGQINPGNRTDKTCSEAKEYARLFILHAYLGLKQPDDLKWTYPASASRENNNKWQAWGHYKKCAENEGLHAVSYATFTRAINRVSRRLRELQKAGRKAAYQVEDPRSGTWSGATHGQFAGQIVEIDHTLVDLEVLDGDDFGLGRMWLTVAIDTYSRVILGYHIGFASPSKRSVMMVIRDMVRRNGYLPLCISIDGGKEFHSIYMDKLLARFRVMKRCRPPHQARNGAIVERLFGTLNRDFWHNLLGNTRLMVNPRSVSREFIAKKKAIWGVEELIEAFDKYVDEYNTKLVHSSLGCTPRHRHESSYRNLLPKQKRQLKYDRSFEVSTMLEPGNSTQLTCRRGALHANGGRYSHPVLRKEINRSVAFPVKYDPMDLRYIYFAHRGQWMTAELVGGKFAHAMSEVEIQLLSDIEEAQHDGKYKKNLQRLFEKAEFVGELKEKEDMIKLRRAQVDRIQAERRDEVASASNGVAEEELPDAKSAIDFSELEEEPIKTGLFDD
jgi:transposase InsO family protein